MTPFNPMLEKTAMRKRMREILQKLSPEEVAQASERAARKLLKHEAFLRAGTIFCYAPMPGEISPALAIEAALREGKRVAYPVITGPGEMVAARPEVYGEWRKSRFGAFEPVLREAEILPPEEIELAVVPLLAFDASNARLGRGGGYYDRYLSHSAAFRLGFAFACQQVAKVPVAEWDLPLDAVVTD